MNQSLKYDAPLADYECEAHALFTSLRAGNRDAAWRFKWQHRRYRDQMVEAVKPAELELADAQLVVAHDYSFETWTDLVAFTEAIRQDGAVARFEQAVEAVVNGDAATLPIMIEQDPELIRARSTRRHHATLLHYVAANGVEGERQKTPPNAVEIAKILLDAGAEPDALADMYEHKCTTMSMLLSSCHPHRAGLQFALAETLLDHGAAIEGPGTEWQSAVMTALQFGYLDTAQALARRGAKLNLVSAAGLGSANEVTRLLPTADGQSRHAALALAAQHGHADVVRLLLDAGEDPSRYNPKGFHAHSTPLHQAIWADHSDVVHLLVERGARLDIRDTVYDGTPLGWAEYGKKIELVEYLRSRGAGTW
jgi:ankyrin repeat protein